MNRYYWILGAFAALVGCSATTVDRMVQRQELKVDRKGQLKLPEAVQAYIAARLVQAQVEAGPRDDAAEARAAMRRAELREREAKAAQRELDLAQARGELVPLVEVRQDARATAELIRTRLLAMPPRAAPLCAAVALGPRQVAEVEAVLADEVNAALEALQQSRFG